MRRIRRRADGILWIEYTGPDGKMVEECTNTIKAAEAQQLLEQRTKKKCIWELEEGYFPDDWLDRPS